MIATRALYGLWLAGARRHHAAFCRGLAHPEEAQLRVLRRIVRANRDTVVGRRWGFDRIDSLADFRRRVPMVRYDEIVSDIDSVAAGERRVLTSEPPTRLLPSGGSTGPAKLVPFNASLGRDFARAVAAWMVDLARAVPAACRGPGYWSVSPAMEAPACASVIPIGFEGDAAYLGRWLAPLVRRVLVAPDSLRHVRPLAEFRFQTLRHLLAARNLRLVSVWHPSFFELLLDARSAHWERLLAVIARTDRCRAAELRDLGPHAPLGMTFPNLSLVSAWGDGAAAAPLVALANRFRTSKRAVGGVHVQPKGLLATEGVVSIPFAGRHPFAVTSTFVELVGDDGRARGVHELALGESYEVVITTSGGLYRYRLGDRVTVDGQVDGTPSVRFSGRADGVVDRVGEKLSEAFAAQVIREAYAPAPVPAFALLAAEGRSTTLFVSEVPSDVECLRARLDVALRRNPCFAYAQDLGQLDPVGVAVVGPEATKRYLAHRHACGQRLGDIKPVHLADNDQWFRVLGAGPFNRTAA